MIRFFLGVVILVVAFRVLHRLDGDWMQVLKNDVKRKGGSRPRRDDA